MPKSTINSIAYKIHNIRGTNLKKIVSFIFIFMKEKVRQHKIHSFRIDLQQTKNKKATKIHVIVRQNNGKVKSITKQITTGVTK